MTYTNNITTVEYTEDIEILNLSSLVEGIYYNANNRTAAFDLNNRIYKYNNVDRADVVNVAKATSAGSEYQNFKRKFGPSENLGDYGDIDWKKVDYNVANYSLAGKLTVSGGVVSGTSTSTSLYSVPKKTYSNYKVGFTVAPPFQKYYSGIVTEAPTKYHNLVATSIEDALAKMSEIASMLGLNFKIKEVTVYFD